jgi:hypothetical protein
LRAKNYSDLQLKLARSSAALFSGFSPSSLQFSMKKARLLNDLAKQTVMAVG